MGTGFVASLSSDTVAFHILILEKVRKTGYNSSCPRETHTIKEEKTMCFDICSIWQLLCRMGGFGC